MSSIITVGQEAYLQCTPNCSKPDPCKELRYPSEAHGHKRHCHCVRSTPFESPPPDRRIGAVFFHLASVVPSYSTIGTNLTRRRHIKYTMLRRILPHSGAAALRAAIPTQTSRTLFPCLHHTTRNYSIKAPHAASATPPGIDIDPSKLIIEETKTPGKLQNPEELVFGKTFTGLSSRFSHWPWRLCDSS